MTTGLIYNLGHHWMENHGLRYSLCDATVVTSYIRLKLLEGTIYIEKYRLLGCGTVRHITHYNVTEKEMV